MAGSLLLFLIPLAVACIAIVVRYAIENRKPPGTRHLPGPWGLPWIGKVHGTSRFYAWYGMYAWAKQYGPIYQRRAMGQIHIVVTKEQIAHELLSQRGAIYSDRPNVPSIYDSKSSTGTGEYLPLMGRNDSWKKQRKYAHGLVVEALNEKYHQYPSIEAKRMLAEMLKNPDNWSKLLENCTANVMTRIIWGSTAPAKDLQDDAWALLHQMSPAGPITNALTPLLLLPDWMSGMAKEAKRRARQAKWFLALENKIRQDITEKRHNDPSFMRSFLEKQQKSSGMDDREGAFFVGMIGVAGVFTMGSPLHTFVVAMLHHPQWLARVQEEIDTQIDGRMPEVSDAPKLPILRSVIKECLRWRPPVPTGVGHELEQDDVYDGYFLPKGSFVIPLEWGFCRDEETYPDAANFRPERWFEPGWPSYKEPLTSFPTIINHTLFGWGRRTCMGQSLTADVVLEACGGMAWGFNFTKASDELGRQIDIPSNEYNSYLIIKPNPFKFDLKPRSEKHRRQILDNWKVAQLNEPLEAEGAFRNSWEEIRR